MLAFNGFPSETLSQNLRDEREAAACGVDVTGLCDGRRGIDTFWDCLLEGRAGPPPAPPKPAISNE